MQHIDAGIFLLRQRFLKNPELFRSDRICFLDTMFGKMWTDKFGQFKKSEPNPDGTGRILPPNAWDYYTGERPKYCMTGKRWTVDVDDLYAPLHVRDDHWIALCISLPRRHITVWDSSEGHVSEPQLQRAVEPIAVMLPHLLRELGGATGRTLSLEPFTHHRVKHGVPKNIKSGDCGVFTVKYIECHALGMDFPPTLCDANIKVIREKMASEVFDETNLRGQDDMHEDWNALDLYEEGGQPLEDNKDKKLLEDNKDKKLLEDNKDKKLLEG